MSNGNFILGLMKSTEAQFKHTIPTIIVLIDIMVSKMVLEMAHIIYPVLCGIVYVIFNVIYYCAGGVRYDNQPYVYEGINWTNPVSALTGCMIILIFTTILHGFLFFLSFVKLFLKVYLSNFYDTISLTSNSELIQ